MIGRGVGGRMLSAYFTDGQLRCPIPVRVDEADGDRFGLYRRVSALVRRFGRVFARSSQAIDVLAVERIVGDHAAVSAVREDDQVFALPVSAEGGAGRAAGDERTTAPHPDILQLVSIQQAVAWQLRIGPTHHTHRFHVVAQ